MVNVQQLFSLDGKVAIVTGASRGIGAATATAFAAAGAHVILVARDKEQLARAATAIDNDRCTIEPADVTDRDTMNAIVTRAKSTHGHLDILVNNAGIIHRANAESHPDDAWHQTIATNLDAVFHWSQAVGRVMLEQHSGKIINIASLLSFFGGLNVAAYSAAKGGVAQLTKALSNEWAKHNIQVNAVAPGYLKTAATAGLRENPARAAEVMARIPAARWGEPEDLAGTMIYLASAASNYMTGAVVVVDGGFLAY